MAGYLYSGKNVLDAISCMFHKVILGGAAGSVIIWAQLSDSIG